jgi:hypothetical protein
VHTVLQQIVDDVLGPVDGPLAELTGADGRDVPWPTARRLDGLVAAAAGAVAARNGLTNAGVAPLLAAQARPYLEVARSMDWPEGVARGVVAAEVEGSVPVDCGRTARFRADRVDREGDTFSLVDYKSGGPPSTAKGEGTRRKHLLADVARGRRLQAAAYAVATPGVAPGVGRYLWLKPGIGSAPGEVRRTFVASDDGEMAAAFMSAVGTIVDGWTAGALPPRVEEAHRPGKVPPACGYCPVAQACLRTDSGFVRRIVGWMSRESDADDEISRAAQALWWLGVERPEGGES